MSGYDRALDWAVITVDILATLETLLQAQPFQEWAVREGREALTEQRYKNTPLYKVWAGTLQGHAAIVALLRELRSLMEPEHDKWMPELHRDWVRVRAELTHGGFVGWNGEDYLSAHQALGTITHEIVTQLSTLTNRREIRRCFENIVGDADLFNLYQGAEQEWTVLAKEQPENQAEPATMHSNADSTAAERDPVNRPESKKRALTVDLDKQTITLDDSTDDVKSLNALRWVKVLRGTNRMASGRRQPAGLRLLPAG